jgi:hypothetical protein
MDPVLYKLVFRYEEHLIKEIEWNLSGNGWVCWEALESNFESCLKFRKDIDNQSSLKNSTDILRSHHCDEELILKYLYEVDHHDDDPKRCPGW